MLLNLQSYDIELKYGPGKELYLADTLSRAHLPNCKSEEETSGSICFIRNNTRFPSSLYLEEHVPIMVPVFIHRIP